MSTEQAFRAFLRKVRRWLRDQERKAAQERIAELREQIRWEERNLRP